MIDFERRRRQITEINLIPLIDIVFHLMVFVMLTTSFVVSESMELSLPSGKAEAGSSAAAGVTRVQIVSDGSVLFNGVAMNSTQMSNALAALIAKDPESKIAVFTTSGVSVQQLVAVLDAVYLSGGHNVQVDKVAG